MGVGSHPRQTSARTRHNNRCLGMPPIDRRFIALGSFRKKPGIFPLLSHFGPKPNTRIVMFYKGLQAIKLGSFCPIRAQQYHIFIPINILWFSQAQQRHFSPCRSIIIHVTPPSLAGTRRIINPLLPSICVRPRR